jgi:hypothetical protein
MMQRMLFIDADGCLYRGFGRLWPAHRWDPVDVRWVREATPGPRPDSWGELVTPAEAERLFAGSTASSCDDLADETYRDLSGFELVQYRPELFDGYDGPIYRRSPEEEALLEAEGRVLAEELRARSLGRSKAGA